MTNEQEQKNIQKEAKKISKWFKIELTISIFGQTLIHWVYPPQND